MSLNSKPSRRNAVLLYLGAFAGGLGLAGLLVLAVGVIAGSL